MPVRAALLALALALAAPLAAPAAGAQPATAARVEAAETAFENGLASYARGEYAEAHRLFLRAAAEFPFHARTTAAYLMAARAAYADGQPERAAQAAATLVEGYPQSRYAADARALVAEAAGADPRPFDLGVVLPVGGADGYLGQAVFNGVRIAVDEHNARAAAGGGRRVRMVFRDSEGTEAGAATALRAALDAGADAVVGPLFSDEALAAAPVAEAAGVALVAPLATDDGVSAGRRFVFQANPTFAGRGRAMARYAVSRLGLRRVGVAVEGGTLGADEGAAFATEARRLGAAVPFEARLGADDWADLDRRVGPAALRGADGVFLPTTGADAPEHAADALRALRAVGEAAPRPLGNTEWEGLTASRDLASRLGAVFTQDFFVAPGAADAFGRRYRELSGLGPDRLALIGYDVTGLLLSLLDGDGPAGGPAALADRLRGVPRYDGVAHRFSFAGGQVNEALFILGYRGGDAVLLE